jgi:tetratricopeptide (TPR) repeat protein
MSEKKSTTTSKSVNQSKPVDKRQEQGKNETPILIWYNKTNDEKKGEDNFIYYNNAQQCIETITQSPISIFLILNGAFATDILSHIHSLKQVDTIFIYCKSSQEQQRCQYLLQHYSKIFDLFSDRQQLLNVIHESVTLYERQSGNEYLRLAEFYQEKNELNRALKYTHKALEVYRKTFSNPNHPLIGRCLNNLGGIYDKQGDVNRSFEYYEQAIKIYSHLSPSLANQPVSNLLKKK